MVFHFCLLFLLIISNNTIASCGTANCPLHINNPILKGIFFFGLSHEYIYQDQIFVGSNRAFVGAIPQHHDEVSTLNQITNFSLGYSFTEFLTLNLNLPYIHREHSHIHNHQGEKVRDSWNFSNIGDLNLISNISVFNNEERTSELNLNTGVKLPTGITDIKNHEGEKAEVTLQPGSGSVDFIVGATYAQNLSNVPVLSGSGFSELPLILNINYRINNKGTDDYKFGNTLLIHLSTAYRFMEKISLLIQANVKLQDKADVGATNEPEENTGGQWVFLSPGLKFHIFDNLSLSSYIQIPLYQNFNGIQQAAPYYLQFAVQKEIDFLN
ncbi:MAG: hypothetical protein Q7S39_07755 [Ignavibacteria bacterium]|nr:hypothetical protein [Ignavibacteria bacterium]